MGYPALECWLRGREASQCMHQEDEALEFLVILPVQQSRIETQVCKRLHILLPAHDLVVSGPIISRQRVLACIWDASAQSGFFRLEHQRLRDAVARGGLLEVSHLKACEAKCHVPACPERLCNFSVSVSIVCVVIAGCDFSGVALVSVPPVDTCNFPCQLHASIRPEDSVCCPENARSMIFQGKGVPLKEALSLVLLVNPIEKLRRAWRLTVVIAHHVTRGGRPPLTPADRVRIAPEIRQGIVIEALEFTDSTECPILQRVGWVSELTGWPQAYHDLNDGTAEVLRELGGESCKPIGIHLDWCSTGRSGCSRSRGG